MRFYSGYGTKPAQKYTVVLQGRKNDGQEFLVASNGGEAGQTGVSHLTQVSGDIYTGSFTVSASATRDSIGLYNYPQSTAQSAEIDWVCLYKGVLENPPLHWSPSATEVLNANINITAKDITFPGGETLEDVLQEGGLLPAVNKGTWKPVISLADGYTAEFQRSSYSVTGNNVTVQTYMRFTQNVDSLNSYLSITGLPFVSTVKTKGGQVQGWTRKTAPKELYPVVNVSSSTLSIMITMISVDITVPASHLEDG